MKMTLNLLPPANKAALRTGIFLAYVQSVLVILFIISVITAGTLFAVQRLTKATYDDLARRTVSSSDEIKDFSAEITAINLYIKQLDSQSSRASTWSKVLYSLTDMVPPGVRVERITVNTANRITLSGEAPTRDDVLLLDRRLKESKLFTDITSPLSNILQQRDIRFDFEMTFGHVAAQVKK